VDGHDELKKGDLIHINAAGHEGSKRRDGCVFFGIMRDTHSKMRIDISYSSIHFESLP
jgi:hypothetical protein